MAEHVHWKKTTNPTYLGEWVGKKLQLYVTMVAAFGTTTNAVRIREFCPR